MSAIRVFRKVFLSDGFNGLGGGLVGIALAYMSQLLRFAVTPATYEVIKTTTESSYHPVRKFLLFTNSWRGLLNLNIINSVGRLLQFR